MSNTNTVQVSILIPATTQRKEKSRNILSFPKRVQFISFEVCHKDHVPLCALLKSHSWCEIELMDTLLKCEVHRHTLFIYLYSQRGKEHLAETKETISGVMHMGCGLFYRKQD